MCEKTGKWIEGDAVLKQKIARVLLTKRGSKPVIRDFGSKLRSFVDLPISEFKAHVTQEIFQKIEKEIPDFLCRSVEFIEAGDGRVTILIKGETNKRLIEHAIST